MGYREVWVDDADLNDFDDSELIDELEDRGYVVFKETDSALFKIRQAYLLDDPQNFRKFLEKLFIDNGMPV
jgi:hypothetical protein